VYVTTLPFPTAAVIVPDLAPENDPPRNASAVLVQVPVSFFKKTKLPTELVTVNVVVVGALATVNVPLNPVRTVITIVTELPDKSPCELEVVYVTTLPFPTAAVIVPTAAPEKVPPPTS
jgi:hypothetical protein